MDFRKAFVTVLQNKIWAVDGKIGIEVRFLSCSRTMHGEDFFVQRYRQQQALQMPPRSAAREPTDSFADMLECVTQDTTNVMCLSLMDML